MLSPDFSLGGHDEYVCLQARDVKDPDQLGKADFDSTVWGKGTEGGEVTEGIYRSSFVERGYYCKEAVVAVNKV